MAIKKKIIITAETEAAQKNVKNLEKEVKDLTKAQKEQEKQSVNSNKIIQALDDATGGAVSRFSRLKDAAFESVKSVKLFSASLSGLSKALIATGIGALVVALGAIVAYWDEIVAFITQAEKKQREYIESLKATKSLISSQIDLLDKQIKLAEENNDSVEELVLKKKELLIDQMKINNLLLKALETELEMEKSTGTQVGFWEGIWVSMKGALSTSLIYEHIANKTIESVERQREIQEKINALTGETIDLELIMLRLNRPKQDNKQKELDLDKQILEELKGKHGVLMEIQALENEFLQSRLEAQTQEENAVREKYFRLIELAKEFGEETELLEEAQQTALQEIRDRYEKKRAEIAEVERMAKLELELLQMEEEGEIKLAKEIEIEEAKRDALLANEDLTESQRALIIQKSANKITGIREDAAKAEEEIERLKNEASLQMLSETIGAISSILGNQSKAGKAFAIAQALINTYQGITAELATKTITPFEFGIKLANIASTAAIGFAAVKNIVKVKTPGGGGGGGVSIPSAPSIPTASTSEPTPPEFDVNTGSVANQLAGLGENQAPIQTYVVANNVTSAQSLDRNIIESASIG